MNISNVLRALCAWIVLVVASVLDVVSRALREWIASVVASAQGVPRRVPTRFAPPLVALVPRNGLILLRSPR